MAYTVMRSEVGKSSVDGYYYEYLCETADDVADLPTGADSDEIGRPRPGSLAYIESDSSARYILKIRREWGEYPMAGGGGGGGGGAIGILWDTESGDVVIELSGGMMWVKVSDTQYTLDDLDGAQYLVYDARGELSVMNLPGTTWREIVPGKVIGAGEELFIISGEAGEYTLDGGTLEVPETGTYFPLVGDDTAIVALVKEE